MRISSAESVDDPSFFDGPLVSSRVFPRYRKLRLIIIDWYSWIPDKGSERVDFAISERGPHPKRCNRRVPPPGLIPGFSWAWTGPIKAYRVAPQTRSVVRVASKEKLSSHTMKFFVSFYSCKYNAGSKSLPLRTRCGIIHLRLFPEDSLLRDTVTQVLHMPSIFLCFICPCFI